ncbi:hypothetical protein MTsPCn5_30830 [Croceitalea sp. MTPC5]|uniref:hypothetical protein n=1 Tax=Croceitalea sp. MTPC5 TaxID=3056565 RepID=UPI002B3E48E2|nr:hypothetical protein MTsPCn5_30830 [Croceitalea sp. MTPC5]
MKEKQKAINGKAKSEKPLLADMHLDGVRFDRRILAAKRNEDTYNMDPVELKQKKPGE